MIDGGWGQGGPADHDESVARVLAAYATRGGMLFGARRWRENPLTLTHVRWQGPANAAYEAVRQPGGDDGMTAEEREAWVQLALHFPAVANAVAGPEAPWTPLALDQQAAAELAQRVQRSRNSQWGGSRPDFGMGSGMRGQPTSGVGSGYGMPPGRPPAPSPHHFSAPTRGSHPSQGFAESGLSGGAGTSDTSGWTGSFQRGTFDRPEVVTVLAIEVEMPPMPTGPFGSEYTRDFARDVAIHFSRAARSIPQVREVRGWMRGERMVLAARIAVAPGSRAPSRSEVEQAAQLLADTLARRTLPYARMASADPGEWAQGMVLPE